MAGNIRREEWKRFDPHRGSRGKWNHIPPIAKISRSILVAAALLLVFNLDPVQAGDTLPKGAGGNLVSKKCQRCHGLGRIQKMRGSREQWLGILDEMINNGLVLNDKEMTVVLNYLEKHLGPPPKK